MPRAPWPNSQTLAFLPESNSKVVAAHFPDVRSVHNMRETASREPASCSRSGFSYTCVGAHGRERDVIPKPKPIYILSFLPFIQDKNVQVQLCKWPSSPKPLGGLDILIVKLKH
ncbi:unnamed protein product [Orchesella dallaii]|uniref:Uncharacterized protein n=1 Tax=Orchesella dallaii TaxID=48710 RepID=A0ABP1R143_9HEXA